MVTVIIITGEKAILGLAHGDAMRIYVLNFVGEVSLWISFVSIEIKKRLRNILTHLEALAF